MENGAKPGNPVPVLPKRREARLPVALNVRILGIDADGKPFHQAVATVDISLSGARITGLTAKLNPGDIVGLQSGGEKCRFKVSWIALTGMAPIKLDCRAWKRARARGAKPCTRPEERPPQR